MKRKPKPRARYGDGCIYRQRGRKIWWIAWYERRADGSRERCYESSGSEDYHLAQRRLHAKLQAIGGRRPTVIDPRKVSFDDLRANYLEYCVLHTRRSVTYTKDNQPTVATLPRLDKFFGGWRANQISIADLKRFRQEGKNDGLGDKRLNRYMATLRKMFNQAVRDELITRAEVPSYFPTTHEPNKAVGAFFIEEKWYEPLCWELKEPLRTAFILAYHYAVRVTEIRRLRWEHVDLKRRVINLPVEITKTGKSRFVPLPANFALEPGKPEELVFDLGDRRDQWRTACVKIGAAHFKCRECDAVCDGRECPTHGKLAIKRMVYVGPQLRHTRHTAVRNMVDKGMNRDRAKEISGHVTDSMFSRYDIGKASDLEDARRLIEGPNGN